MPGQFDPPPAPVSSAFLSVYQSAASEHPGLVQAAAKAATTWLERTALPRVAPAGLADDAWICARLGLAWMRARLSGHDAAAVQLYDDLKGAACDPDWIETLDRYLAYFGPGGNRRQVPYRSPAATGCGVLPLPPGARIALISDWGLGTQAADDVLQQAMSLRPDVLIHLGDVYYSGTAAEYDRNFYRPIAARLGPDGQRIPVYILSGNHDMYSGGDAYYAMIDRLNPEPLRQRAAGSACAAPTGPGRSGHGHRPARP